MYHESIFESAAAATAAARRTDSFVHGCVYQASIFASTAAAAATAAARRIDYIVTGRVYQESIFEPTAATAAPITSVAIYSQRNA